MSTATDSMVTAIGAFQSRQPYAQVRRTDIKRMLASLAVHQPADPVAFLDELVGNPQANERRPTWAGNDRCDMVLATSSTTRAAGGWSGELPAIFSPPLASSLPIRPSTVLDSRSRKVREFPDATGSRVERRMNRLALAAEQERAKAAANDRRVATPQEEEEEEKQKEAPPAAVSSSGVEVEVSSVAIDAGSGAGLSQEESDEIDGAIASEIVDELLDHVLDELLEAS